MNPNSFEEIGCIHACQGMEFDCVGAFIGKNLYYDDEEVRNNRSAVSKDDTTSGIRASSTSNKGADRLIRCTYKIFLSCGLKGCFSYCEDPALRSYIRSKVKAPPKYK